MLARSTRRRASQRMRVAARGQARRIPPPPGRVELQEDLAARELKQIEQQMTAAQIRLAIAQQELATTTCRSTTPRRSTTFLRDKYTNQDLYQWMVGQISGVYFQSYQLAYDLAKRAERCLQHELGLATDDVFIQLRLLGSPQEGPARRRVAAPRPEAAGGRLSRRQPPRVRADQARVARRARARAADRAQGNGQLPVRRARVAVRPGHARATTCAASRW